MHITSAAHRRPGAIAAPPYVLAAAVVFATAVTPLAANAQRARSSVDLQESRLRYADTVDATATGVTPSLRLEWPRAAVAAYGTYAQLGSAWSADGSLSASLFAPARRGVSGELGGTVGGSAHQDGTRTGSATGGGRVHLDGTSAGVWLGVSGGATSDGYIWRGVRQGEAGLWLADGPGTVTLTALPTTVDDTIRYTDLSAEGNWQGGRLEIDAIVGSRAGARLPTIASNATTWGSASAALWVFPRVAVIASAGKYPVDYTQGFPGVRFATVGVRLALARRGRTEDPSASDAADEGVPGDIEDFQLYPASPKGRVFRVRAPGARTVEVMGDFTGWEPRTLTSVGGGWYAVELPLLPGTHQVAVRVDGKAWRAPPGLPVVRDEFGGSTGVLVFKDRE